MKSLSFELYDLNNNKYNIKIDFQNQYFDIKATNELTFPKKEYNGIYYLNCLLNTNNFFKSFNLVPDYYNTFVQLKNLNSFKITTYASCVVLTIQKQYYMQKDVELRLNEKILDINSIVNELCKKCIELEGERKSCKCTNCREIENKYNDLKAKYDNLLNEIKIIKSSIFLDEDKMILDNFFDYQKPTSCHLIYSSLKHGEKRNDFFNYCKNKNNLLFFIIDSAGNKFGAYISSYLKPTTGSIVDYNAFLFSINKNKKFKTLNPENSIIVDTQYVICFGGKIGQNDLYLNFGNLLSGMNIYQTFGDKNYDTTNNNARFTIKSLDVYKINF